MREEYKILGVDESASTEEIKTAYQTLKDKYMRERFYEGEVGNEAAKNLTKIENAYSEIMSQRAENADSQDSASAFSEVESLIKDKKLDKAQAKLDDINDRNAEWH